MNKILVLLVIPLIYIPTNTYAKYNTYSSKCYDQKCIENVKRIKKEDKCSFMESVFSSKTCAGSLISKEYKLSKKRSYNQRYENTLQRIRDNAAQSKNIPTTYYWGGNSYDISGYGNGQYVSGNIDSDGDGYITLDNGSEVSFDGSWSGKGEIEGYDENGNYYTLEVD